MRLHYLNGEDPIAQQAAQFWNASLLIWPHGATMALTTFLPRVRGAGRGGAGGRHSGAWLVLQALLRRLAAFGREGGCVVQHHLMLARLIKPTPLVTSWPSLRLCRARRP